MKMSQSSFLLIALLSILGCDIENEKSDFICLQAENSSIDGSTGFRDVFRVNLGYGIDIGYSHQGVLVPHSECAPARVTFSGTSTSFEYFEYGQPKENSGIYSITFSSLAYGKQAFYVEREDRQGQPVYEWGEREYDRDDRGKITKQIWLSEFPLSQVISENDHENSGVIQVVAQLGEASKTVRYNSNSLSYDCLYSNNAGNDMDLNCENESALDSEYLGVEASLLSYIENLSDSPHYETVIEELCEDVNRYERDDGTCED